MTRELISVTLTKKQIKFVKENINTKSWDQLGKALKMSHTKVFKNARLLGIKKDPFIPKGRTVTLTDDQQKTVRELYGKEKPKDIAAQIGVTYGKLFNNIYLMGLNSPAKVVEMEGYFDVDKFYKKYYSF